MNGVEGRFKELSDNEYTRLRRGLLRTKGSELQRKFLRTVRNGDGFLEYFSTIGTVGTDEALLVPERMTESEFKEPPADSERSLYMSWSSVAPATACRSTFWAYVTLHHVRNERIEPLYLAANGGTLPGGAERIDFALNDTTKRGAQQVDSCVRTILRRLGGLPEVRGNRSVYVDCPFARAWWRERVVEQASRGDATVAARVRRIIRISQTYWEKLVDRIVFRNSTFGSENIRNAFFRALSELVQANPDSNLARTKGLQRLCRRATAYQGGRELSILTDSELDELMEGIVRSADSSGLEERERED